MCYQLSLWVNLTKIPAPHFFDFGLFDLLDNVTHRYENFGFQNKRRIYRPSGQKSTLWASENVIHLQNDT